MGRHLFCCGYSSTVEHVTGTYEALGSSISTAKIKVEVCCLSPSFKTLHPPRVLLTPGMVIGNQELTGRRPTSESSGYRILVVPH